MKLFKENTREYTNEGMEISNKIEYALDSILKEYYSKVENKSELQSVLTNTCYNTFIFHELLTDQ